jgi:HCOMODA/2-hydroxy-3-carboxy-muconic semialdehyde decarboxylase
MSFLPDHSERAEVARANRILAHKGVLDAFGHVSARTRDRHDRFLISRNLAPALVREHDILTVDLDARVIDDDRTSYLERFIHAEIYRARPDVAAIVHSHAPAIIPFTVTDEPLRPVAHVAGFLGGGVARFDTREVIGDGSDLLVSDAALGAALARSLGAAPLVLMRGHGFVTVADSLQVAVFQAVYAQVNARIQLEASALGRPTFLSEAESRATATSNAGQVQRAWSAWTAEVA